VLAGKPVKISAGAVGSESTWRRQRNVRVLDVRGSSGPVKTCQLPRRQTLSGGIAVSATIKTPADIVSEM